MKKILLLALALVIGSGTLFANNVEPNLDKEEIRDQIVELLNSPKFELKRDLQVEIAFTFSSEGEIVILKVNSKDREVLDYLRNNLNYKKINNPGEQNKIYSMPLKIVAE
jgi:hypothetical protein